MDVLKLVIVPFVGPSTIAKVRSLTESGLPAVSTVRETAWPVVVSVQAGRPRAVLSMAVTSRVMVICGDGRAVVPAVVSSVTTYSKLSGPW